MAALAAHDSAATAIAVGTSLMTEFSSWSRRPLETPPTFLPLLNEAGRTLWHEVGGKSGNLLRDACSAKENRDLRRMWRCTMSDAKLVRAMFRNSCSPNFDEIKTLQSETVGARQQPLHG